MSNPTQTLTVTEFLLQRLADDEAAALAATPSPWMTSAGAFGDPANGPDHMRVVDSTWKTACDGTVARLDYDQQGGADAAHIARHDPARVLAQVAALRAVVELHKAWPVLVERPVEFSQSYGDDINSVTFRASQQMQWLTQQEYVARFGTGPPTAPTLLALIQPYADHPDFDPAWLAS